MDVVDIFLCIALCTVALTALCTVGLVIENVPPLTRLADKAIDLIGEWK